MVIGVDNDELLVSHSSPPLTSIHPGHFEMGFKAAAELDRLMSAKQKCSVNSTNIQPLRIVERESTKNVKPAALLVSRAKRFINQKYASGITAQDVTKYLGCSRELIDLRFREIEGITLKAELENCRLTEVKRLLKTTSRPISTIAKQCGFKSTSHLTHLFSLRNGLSPLAWRNAHEDDQMQKVLK
jgi:AraC-like DNA-binding protein